MKTIPLKQLLEKLKYKDLRSVRRWCEQKSVAVMKQGLNEFVYESNFLEAFDKPFIEKLKSRFGKDWESVYVLYRDGNVIALNTLNNLVSNPISTSFRAKSVVEKNYQSKFREYAKTKIA
jgi:hypothetical protein